MSSKVIKYQQNLIPLARKLRKSMTYGKARLWSRLKKKQLMGFKFRRQTPIDNYIVDFYCSELKLVIEIDGHSHNEVRFDYDETRTDILNNLGLKVIRFNEKDVIKSIEEVIQTLENYISEIKPPLS